MGLSRERAVEGRWVPNLVAGVSVWKLAPDLNAPELFDGRLLEPDTEGADALPDAVEWDLTGLIPFDEAQRTAPVKAELALDAFRVCLRRAEAWLDAGGKRFADAFTLPPLSHEGGPSYFFSPRDGRLYVKNWGARPHRAGGAEVHLLGPASFLAQGPTPRDAPPERRRRGLAIALGLSGLLALLGGILWIVLAPPPEATPTAEAEPPDSPPVEPAPVEPAPVEPPPSADPPPLPEPTQRIFFEVDQPNLGPSEYAALEEARVYLEAHPAVRRLRIEGHTDGRGEPTHNEGLGGARAATVLEWLVARGVDRARLEAVTCADRIPADTNQTDAGRQHNRRAELFVVAPPLERAPHPGCEPAQPSSAASLERPTAAATPSR